MSDVPQCPHVLEYQLDEFPMVGLPCLLPAGHGGQHVYRETEG